MLNFLPALLVGLIATALMLLNMLFWVPILLIFAVVKLIFDSITAFPEARP
nr:hypothetical protein [Rhodoferax sp.]